MSFSASLNRVPGARDHQSCLPKRSVKLTTIRLICVRRSNNSMQDEGVTAMCVGAMKSRVAAAGKIQATSVLMSVVFGSIDRHYAGGGDDSPLASDSRVTHRGRQYHSCSA